MQSLADLGGEHLLLLLVPDLLLLAGVQVLNFDDHGHFRFPEVVALLLLHDFAMIIFLIDRLRYLVLGWRHELGLLLRLDV